MPSRAGKTKKAKDAVVMGLVEALPAAASAPMVAEPVLAAVA
jgi:flagellar transcriptional activator FlhC